MKLNRNEFLAVVYADLFNYPLTVSEAKLWRVNAEQHPGMSVPEVQAKGGLLVLKGRSRLIKIRPERNRSSLRKHHLAEKLISKISRIPSIKAVFLTGSAAANNASEDSDIDLMVITSPNTLWLTRLIVILLLKLIRKYRTPHNISDKFCPNIFLDTNHLEINDQNLYVAHEILQALCLFDRGGVEHLWLRENYWTKKYLPIAHEFKIGKLEFKNLLKIKNWKLEILAPLEFLAFALQYLYQLPKQTSERVGWGFAFFHPNNLSSTVLRNFENKQQALLYN